MSIKLMNNKLPYTKMINLYKINLLHALIFSIIIHIILLFYLSKKNDNKIIKQSLNLDLNKVNINLNHKEPVIKKKKTTAKPLIKTEKLAKNTTETSDNNIIPIINDTELKGYTPAPKYPNKSLRLKQEGQVLLKALINNEGLVIKIELSKSSGYTLLDKAAINAVKKWHYNLNNNINAQWVIIPIEFIIR